MLRSLKQIISKLSRITDHKPLSHFLVGRRPCVDGFYAFHIITKNFTENICRFRCCSGFLGYVFKDFEDCASVYVYFCLEAYVFSGLQF